MKPLLLAACALGGMALIISAAHADITISTEPIPPGCPPCDQSVNFAPANSGTTVTGDTNPAPVYDVFVDSLQGQTLHGSGSGVDTGGGGPGFNSILIRPDIGWAWSAIEFQLDSFASHEPLDGSGLTITAYGGPNQTDPVSQGLPFPWEGNGGENQQYIATAINGDLIYSLQIDYLPTDGNTLQDIHNIDVQSEQVPEPSTLLVLGASLMGLGIVRRRRHA